MINKTLILESLAIYRDRLYESPNTFGILEYEDPDRDSWLPDIVSGRSDHEYTLEKISNNPFSTKPVNVGTANVELSNSNAKMNFFNREKGKYKRNDVEEAKRRGVQDKTKSGKDFIDPADIGIHFDMKFGVPILVYGKENRNMISANSDKIKQLPPELCKTKIDDPRYSYLSWVRDDIKKINSGTWVDVNLGYVVSQRPITESPITAIGVSHHGKFPDGASTTVPSGIIDVLFNRTNADDTDLYMYLPISEFEDMVYSTLNGEYIRYNNIQRGECGIMKISQHFPFISRK